MRRPANESPPPILRDEKERKQFHEYIDRLTIKEIKDLIRFVRPWHMRRAKKWQAGNLKKLDRYLAQRRKAGKAA